MGKYNVIVKWCEEYELEIEADTEEEAYNKAIDMSSDGSSYASDCYLLDVQVEESDEDDDEDEEDDD